MLMTNVVGREKGLNTMGGRMCFLNADNIGRANQVTKVGNLARPATFTTQGTGVPSGHRGQGERGRGGEKRSMQKGKRAILITRGSKPTAHTRVNMSDLVRLHTTRKMPILIWMVGDFVFRIGPFSCMAVDGSGLLASVPDMAAADGKITNTCQTSSSYQFTFKHYILED